MKRVKQLAYGVAGVAGSIISMAGVAHADLTFPTIALTDVTTIAAGMLGLLGAVWALKKALGFFGR